MPQVSRDPWSSPVRAADRGDVAAVDRLLRIGADQRRPIRGQTPQQLAMRYGHVEVLRMLQRRTGCEQRLQRPPGAGPETVVLRRARPGPQWIVLALVPGAIGVVVGVALGSNSAVVAGALLSAAWAQTIVVLSRPGAARRIRESVLPGSRAHPPGTVRRRERVRRRVPGRDAPDRERRPARHRGSQARGRRRGSPASVDRTPDVRPAALPRGTDRMRNLGSSCQSSTWWCGWATSGLTARSPGTRVWRVTNRTPRPVGT